MGVEILLEDGPLLAVNKPAGLITQAMPGGIPNLVCDVKGLLKERYQKPGNVYLGMPHRLDRPVSGVVVFSKNSKCAARLAEQFRDRSVQKVYWAIVPDVFPEDGQLIDWLIKRPEVAHVDCATEQTAGARQAVLNYRVVRRFSHAMGLLAQLEIELVTGRMHQIRVQLASRGAPIVGDVQYGSAHSFPGQSTGDEKSARILLHARQVTLQHPIRYEPVTITAPLPEAWSDFVEVPSR